MTIKLHFIRVLLAALCLAACQKAEDEFASNPCYFSFNASYHNTSMLLSAVNGYETYALVSTRPLNGKTYSVITEIYGQAAHRDDITTELETSRTHALGLSDGLIIGRSTMDQTLYAYDRQCPNCYKATKLTAARLGWADNGQTVRCPKCRRVYNLSNRGVVAQGEQGDPLLRYRVSFDGTWLLVQN